MDALRETFAELATRLNVSQTSWAGGRRDSRNWLETSNGSYRCNECKPLVYHLAVRCHAGTAVGGQRRQRYTQGNCSPLFKEPKA